MNAEDVKFQSLAIHWMAGTSNSLSKPSFTECLALIQCKGAFLHKFLLRRIPFPKPIPTWKPDVPAGMPSLSSSFMLEKKDFPETLERSTPPVLLAFPEHPAGDQGCDLAFCPKPLNVFSRYTLLVVPGMMKHKEWHWQCPLPLPAVPSWTSPILSCSYRCPNSVGCHSPYLQPEKGRFSQVWSFPHASLQKLIGDFLLLLYFCWGLFLICLL